MLRGKIMSGAALAPYGMSRVELALAACKARPSLLSCYFNSYSYICSQEWPLAVPGISSVCVTSSKTRGALRNACSAPQIPTIHSIRWWLINPECHWNKNFYLPCNVFFCFLSIRFRVQGQRDRIVVMPCTRPMQDRPLFDSQHPIVFKNPFLVTVSSVSDVISKSFYFLKQNIFPRSP